MTRIESSPDSRPLVEMARITKRFGRVTVLDGVDFAVHAGEVHVLAGENGAGKSTLIKILAGVHTDFEGGLRIGDSGSRLAGPLDAARRGVAVIHQELSLVPSMSVADNVFLGRTITGRIGLVQDRRQHTETRRLLDQFGMDVAPDQAVEQLPVASQQLVEIIKALGQDARVIVMDEPTSALSAPEVVKLFRWICQLKARGCGIVYITHKMEEIEQIADRISVLRDGQLVGTALAAELTIPKLIHWMVGRDVERFYSRSGRHAGAERLRLERFSVRRGGWCLVDDISLSVRAGEIVGLAGLQGSGNSQLLMGLFGAYGRDARGSVVLDGVGFRPVSPRRSIQRRMALLTNDRKTTGLVLSMSIVANTTMAQLQQFSPGGWCRTGRERAAAIRMAEVLHLRAASIDMPVGQLSGGNQQKVALAKWVLAEPRVLLLDEPTRGVDIGAKWEIYELMDHWASQGISILLVTSEMPELLAMSDRIVVMHRGRITAEFSHEQAEADSILEAAMGQTGRVDIE